MGIGRSELVFMYDSELPEWSPGTVVSDVEILLVLFKSQASVFWNWRVCFFLQQKISLDPSEISDCLPGNWRHVSPECKTLL